MPKVLFTQDRVVQDENRGTEDQTIYRAGQVYDLDQGSVDRWVKRGIATTDEAKIKEAESQGAEAESKTSKPAPSGDSVTGSQTNPGQPGGASGSKDAPDSSSAAENNVRNPEQTLAGQQAKAETEGAKEAEGETKSKPDALTTTDFFGPTPPGGQAQSGQAQPSPIRRK